MTDLPGVTAGPTEEERKKLKGELWIVLPFFVFCTYVFVGSFRYKFEAATVPMILGFSTMVLAGLRLFHIFVPTSRIGQFKEAGLAGEFDQLKEEIEEEKLKGKYEEEPSAGITPQAERKAFLALAFSCLSFVLFGYVVGSLLVVVGTTLFYGYRRVVPILITSGSLFVLLYVVLHRLFGAEVGWGVLLQPILASMDLI